MLKKNRLDPFKDYKAISVNPEDLNGSKSNVRARSQRNFLTDNCRESSRNAGEIEGGDGGRDEQREQLSQEHLLEQDPHGGGDQEDVQDARGQAVRGSFGQERRKTRPHGCPRRSPTRSAQ